MPESKYKLIKHCHINALLQIFNSIYYCMICSAFIITKTSSQEFQIKIIKPDNYIQNNEILPCPLWSSEEKNELDNFINKKEYLKQRQPIIKCMKNMCSSLCLCLKTYFLSVTYFDKICSKISFFNPNYLFHICLLCIILASKFNEHSSKVLKVQDELKKEISKSYLNDEIYVLQLLNYNLNLHTSYDLLLDILNFGFIFEGENYTKKKINYVYSLPIEILYICSEINLYIDMTAKQTAISIIGFSRELLNLTPFNENIKKIFCINNENIYYSSLKIIKKKIKIECGDNNQKSKVNNIIDENNAKKEGNNNKAIAIYCNEYKKLME